VRECVTHTHTHTHKHIHAHTHALGCSRYRSVCDCVEEEKQKGVLVLCERVCERVCDTHTHTHTQTHTHTHTHMGVVGIGQCETAWMRRKKRVF